MAGGHGQTKSEFSELVTSAVHTESVFLICALAATEGRHCAIIGIKGAYLNARKYVVSLELY